MKTVSTNQTIVSSIQKETYSGMAMCKALLRLSKEKPELAEKIDAALDTALDRYDSDKPTLDVEADIVPTEYWLGVLGGDATKVMQVIEEAEQKADPSSNWTDESLEWSASLKRWLLERSFETKLAAVLLYELVRCESDLPDRKIGNNIYREFISVIFKDGGENGLGYLRGITQVLIMMEV